MPVSDRLHELAESIYASLAVNFPVCMASDEFHFFPQYCHSKPNWSTWDNFEPDALQTVSKRLSRWQQQLEGIYGACSGEDRLDIDLLLRALGTLTEQLQHVCWHLTQPTYYLSIAGIGLAEALEHSPEAIAQRIQGLPGFIDGAIGNLRKIPVLYRDLGMEMTHKMISWLSALPIPNKAGESAAAALGPLAEHLHGINTTADFRLPIELYGKMAGEHMGSQMKLDEIAWHLNQEIEETRKELQHQANRISCGAPWQIVFSSLSAPGNTDGQRELLFKRIIARLKAHCMAEEMVPPTVGSDCDVAVQTVPDHMTPIRSNAAYSMPPGHPPRGGTFYIFSRDQEPTLAPDIVLLTAHETYPGHHLLDTLRWQLPRPLRRSLEFPLFYEGWASFAEEILFDTGFFSGPVDRLLMARRRLWRAIRGRIDLMLHTGQWDLEQAAAVLSDHGVTPVQAASIVRRYALKPAYQLAYTMGRRKFRRLYTNYLEKGHTPAQFVRQALAHGEIKFDHLAALL